MAAQQREERLGYGIVLVLLANLMFANADAIVKWLSIAAYSVVQLAFLRYFIHLLITAARVPDRQTWQQHRKISNLKLVLLRAFLLIGLTVCNYTALQYIPLTLTATIMFSTPITVTLLSQFFLKEKIGPWRWFAIFLGFVGVVVAIRPFNAEFHWAALVMFVGTLFFAVYLILTRHLAGKVSAESQQLYLGIVGTSIFLPLVFFYWKMPETWWHWIVLCGSGFFGWYGHQLLTRAFHYASASLLTPYTYSFIIYLTIWSIVLFGQYPDNWTILGAFIIVLSGLIIWAREQIHLKGTS